MLKISLISAILGISLAGCAADDRDTEARTGVLVGALAGGAAGHQLEDEDKARLIGASVGAIAGAMVGSYMDKQQQALQEKLQEEQRSRELEITRLEDDTLKLYLRNDVLFDFDSAEVKAASGPILAKLAEHLVEYPQTAVYVIGHTDSAGAEEYNLHLSERRASSVATLLNRQGVAAARIRIEGRGEAEPRDSDDTEAARRRNRRIEIYLRPIVEGKEDMAYESPRY